MCFKCDTNLQGSQKTCYNIVLKSQLVCMCDLKLQSCMRKIAAKCDKSCINVY